MTYNVFGGTLNLALSIYLRYLEKLTVGRTSPNSEIRQLFGKQLNEMSLKAIVCWVVGVI